MSCAQLKQPSRTWTAAKLKNVWHKILVLIRSLLAPVESGSGADQSLEGRIANHRSPLCRPELRGPLLEAIEIIREPAIEAGQEACAELIAERGQAAVLAEQNPAEELQRQLGLDSTISLNNGHDDSDEDSDGEDSTRATAAEAPIPEPEESAVGEGEAVDAPEEASSTTSGSMLPPWMSPPQSRKAKRKRGVKKTAEVEAAMLEFLQAESKEQAPLAWLRGLLLESGTPPDARTCLRKLIAACKAGLCSAADVQKAVLEDGQSVQDIHDIVCPPVAHARDYLIRTIAAASSAAERECARQCFRLCVKQGDTAWDMLDGFLQHGQSLEAALEGLQLIYDEP